MEFLIVSEVEALPILEVAARRLGEGWSVFTCSTVAEDLVGGIFGHMKQFDLGPLIQQIESLGWRLDTLNHVPVPRAESALGVRAHMLFRRAG